MRRGRHPRLVVEDPPEVVAVGEDVGLERQERAAAVDEVDARQPVLERDLLGPEVLLDRHRVVGAALDRRVVGDDDAGRALDPADAGDDAGARGVVVVQAVGGERAQLEERASPGRAGGRCARGPAACRARGAARSTGRRRRRRGRRGRAGAARRSSTRAAIASWLARVSAAAGSSRLRRTGMARMIGRVPMRARWTSAARSGLAGNRPNRPAASSRRAMTRSALRPQSSARAPRRRSRSSVAACQSLPRSPRSLPVSAGPLVTRHRRAAASAPRARAAARR